MRQFGRVFGASGEPHRAQDRAQFLSSGPTTCTRVQVGGDFGRAANLFHLTADPAVQLLPEVGARAV